MAVLAGDGTLNEAAGGLAGIRRGPRAAARRLHERVRAHPRGRLRPRGRRPPAGGVAPTRVIPPHRTRRGRSPTQVERPFLFHLGVGFDAAIIRRMEAALLPEAAFRPPRLRSGDHRHLAAPLRPRVAHPVPGRHRHRHRRRRHDAGRARALRGDLEFRPVHVRRPPPAAHRAGRVARRRAHRHRADEPAAPAGAAGGRSRPSARFTSWPPRPRSCRSPTSGACRSAARPVPLAGRRRLPGRGGAARVSHRPDCLTVVTP